MSEATQLKPTVFVGSSKEGLAIAEAIQVNLDYSCEVTIWHQGVFGLGEGSLEALVERLDTYDFAVLVVTPDDISISREVTKQTPRDNVLLELGLFIGGLGRKRTFIVFNRDEEIKLPTDLAGVTAAGFSIHQDKNLLSSLGAPTTLIKGAIHTHGRRKRVISTEIDTSTQFQIIHDLLEPAAEQFLICMHELGISLQRDSRLFGTGIGYTYSLKNKAGGRGEFSVDALCRKLPDAGLLTADLRNNVKLTLRGKEFAQWLIENGHKASYFQTELATWGDPNEFNFPWTVDFPSDPLENKPGS